MGWLSKWPRGVGLGISFKFGWPDAGRDRCKKCGAERRFHEGADHAFVEKGE